MAINPQIPRNVPEKLAEIALGLEDESRPGGTPEPLEKLEQQSRLAHTGFGNQSQKPSGGLNAVVQ